jgi:hypothetical protein
MRIKIFFRLGGLNRTLRARPSTSLRPFGASERAVKHDGSEIYGETSSGGGSGGGISSGGWSESSCSSFDDCVSVYENDFYGEAFIYMHKKKLKYSL